MAKGVTPLRPGEFCRWALKAEEAADGLRRRRKRDQRPDAIGLAIKSDILARAAEEDPEPNAFEAWLARQVITAPVGGPVRAMSLQILEEFRFASVDEALARWLRAGAPSDDAQTRPMPSDEEILGCTCAGLHLHLGDEP
jgi:hypothetical protein